MSTALTAPLYSFVQPGTADLSSCYPDPELCLPISSLVNWAFYFKVSDVDTLKMILSSSFQVYATIVPADADCTPSVQTTGPFSAPPRHIQAAQSSGVTGNRVEIFSATTHGSMGMWFDFYPYGPSYPFGAADIEVGECFKFQLIVVCQNSTADITRIYNLGCTQCFKRISDDECEGLFSSVIKYTNGDDAFGFNYSHATGFMNSAEMPFYLRDPYMVNDSKSYTRSDGSVVKLSERKEEVYVFETDTLPYLWHRSIDIALSHDTVMIGNQSATSFDPVNTATSFVKKEDYAIEYNPKPYSAYGKGTCKLTNAKALNLINNNCS